MADPTSAAKDQMLWATPLAAICTVPNMAVMELNATFASWNRPFSMELGTAMPNSLRTMLLFQVKRPPQVRAAGFFPKKQSTVMATAANTREIVEGQATPATPA